MNIVTKLILAMLVVSAMGTAFRGKNIFNQAKMGGIDEPVRGFGIPKGYQRKVLTKPTDTITIPEPTFAPKYHNHGKDKNGYHVELPTSIFHKPSYSRKATNPEQGDKRVDPKLISNHQHSEGDDNYNYGSYRTLTILIVMLLVALTFVFVKFSKISGMFTRNNQGSMYKLKKYQHFSKCSDDEEEDLNEKYEEESVKLMKSEIRSSFTAYD